MPATRPADQYRGLARLCVLAAIVALTACSCGLSRSPKPPVNYYTLDYAVPGFPDYPRSPAVLQVARFAEAADNNLSQMLYSQGPNLRDEYFYQRWRAMPGDLVSSFLLRDMQQCGLFTAAVGGGSMATSSFRVEGRVDRFFELDLSEAWQADLSVTVTLLRVKPTQSSRLVVFQKSYETREPAAQKTAQSLAEAMSRAMEGLSRQILADIYDAAIDQSATEPPGQNEDQAQ